MKRYCQTLKLKNDEKLIQDYIAVHQNVWPEVKEAMREVGITDMQIYINQNTLFMVCDTVDNFDWQKDNARLNEKDIQKKWEKYVSQFQDCDTDASSDEKWTLMDKIFQL